MDIILKKDVAKLGYKDDLVKVRDGYASNFLIPKGLAMLASESAKKERSENLKQRSFKEEKIRNEAKKAAATIKEMSIKVTAKVGEKGKIFGSINALQVAEAIKKLGFPVDRKDITMKEESIKQTGKYEASIRFHRDVIETFSFEVVGEE